MAKRTQQLQLRVTPSEKASIRAAASRSGMDMSSWILSRALPNAASELMALVDELRVEEPMQATAVWAAVIDQLQAATPMAFSAMVSLVDADQLDDVAANYLAALVEVAAAQKIVSPPSWTRRVQPLRQPYFGTELRRVREYLLLRAPVAFRRRNLFVDAGVGDCV